MGVAEAHLTSVDDPLADLLSRYARTHGPFTTAEAAAALRARHGGRRRRPAPPGPRRTPHRGRVPPAGHRAASGSSPGCCGDCAAGRWRPPASRSSRSTRPRSPASCRRGRASGRRCVAPTACSPSSTSWPGCRCRRRHGRAWCCPPGWPTTPPRCSTSCSAPARWSGRAPAPCPAATGGCSCIRPISCSRCCATSPSPTPSARPSSTRSTAAERSCSASSPRPSTSRTTRSWPRRCGSWCGPGGSPATRSRRCARCSAVAVRIARRHARPAPGCGAGRGRASSPRIAQQGPPTVSGRWFRLDDAETDPTKLQLARTEALLARYGVVTRGSVVAEQTPGGFAATYRVLRELEQTGACLRGYYIDTLGAAQFASPATVDRLRSHQRDDDTTPPTSRRSCSRQPTRPTRSVRRSPGPTSSTPTSRPATGRPARPGRSPSSTTATPCCTSSAAGARSSCSTTIRVDSTPAAAALAALVRTGRVPRLTVETAGGRSVGSTALGDALREAGFVPHPKGLRLDARR